MKKTYKIDVDCANCANKMEEAAKNTAGVKDATVNFMMLKMIVEFEDGQDPKAVMKDVLKNCKKVKKISVGKNVKTIGKNAFKGCKKLKTITLANKKVTIKKGAFAGLNTKKITIKAPKMSKKDLKKFKKALKKAGFKGKVK